MTLLHMKFFFTIITLGAYWAALPQMQISATTVSGQRPGYEEILFIVYLMTLSVLQTT